MTRKNKNLLVGVALLIVSIAVLFFNLRGFEGGFNKVWPAILLLVGVLLFIFYFSTRKKKKHMFVLFIATFIATSSVPLFVLTFTSFERITIVWPAFLFTLGLSLLSMYYYGNKKKVLAVFSAIIISISLIVWIIYSMETEFGLVIGASIFLLGAAFLTMGLGRKTGQEAKALETAETAGSDKYPAGRSTDQDEDEPEDTGGG
jgi:peptidoglycan/LPS O-acetylase OafA/YrhL